jgi:hypothetical protein
MFAQCRVTVGRFDTQTPGVRAALQAVVEKW